MSFLTQDHELYFKILKFMVCTVETIKYPKDRFDNVLTSEKIFSKIPFCVTMISNGYHCEQLPLRQDMNKHFKKQ